MAINPLQAFSPKTILPGPETPNKKSGSASFDTFLSSLRTPVESSSALTGQQTAVEMFRIEMMQSSLSLSGDGAASRPGTLPGLAALLVGPTDPGQAGQFCRPARAAQAALAAAGVSGAAAAGAQVAPAGSGGGSAARSTGPEPAAAPESGIAAIDTTASQYLGTPYRFGGEGADGIDCSSFVQKVFREHQINLPRTAREQSLVGSEVAPGDLKKGDLVFFHTYAAYPSHVGIYLGDGKMIHASSGKGEVTVSDLNNDYYRSRYLGAKRMV
jgi:cell wall-associated NlpC family hydrolase